MSLEPISDAVGTLLQNLGIADPGVSARLVREWLAITGEPWDKATRPVRLRNGELVLEVSSPAEVSVLRYRTGELLAQLDRHLGEGIVEVVRLKTARKPF